MVKLQYWAIFNSKEEEIGRSYDYIYAMRFSNTVDGGTVSLMEGGEKVRGGWTPVDDTINQPAHYTSGSIECIDAIRAALTPEEFRGFCKGNVIKYTWRERLKGGDESLKKAEWYLKRLTDGAD